jgi:hypothetical protein
VVHLDVPVQAADLGESSEVGARVERGGHGGGVAVK